ncbi:MAG: hypothetical protein MUP44_06410 [Anaerolineales bacterium]|nr:hypothetical protein [Anaerolineales bacterium]
MQVVRGISLLVVALSIATFLCSKADAEMSSRSANIPGVVDTPSIVVEEGVGFNDILIGDPQCTLEFIKVMLGEPDEETGLWLNYRERYGLDFWKPSSESPLQEIRLNKGFAGRLSSGISVASSMDDVFKTYGEPVAEWIVAEDEDIDLHNNNRTLYTKGECSKIR